MTGGARLEERLRALTLPVQPNESCAEEEALYRYATKEATPNERREFESHLSGCDLCRADLRLFHQVKTPHRGPSRVQTVLAFVPIAAAAALLLLVLPQPTNQPAPELRPKGSFHLHVAVQRGAARLLPRPGFELREGDLLGFFYSAPVPTHLLVLSANAAGEVTRLHPEIEQRLLPAGVELRLEDGARWRVDENTGSCHWLAAFFSEAPITEAAAVQALQAAILSTNDSCALALPALDDIAVEILPLRPSP